MSNFTAFWLALIIKGVCYAISGVINLMAAVLILTITVALPLTLLRTVLNFVM